MGTSRIPHLSIRNFQQIMLLEGDTVFQYFHFSGNKYVFKYYFFALTIVDWNDLDSHAVETEVLQSSKLPRMKWATVSLITSLTKRKISSRRRKILPRAPPKSAIHNSVLSELSYDQENSWDFIRTPRKLFAVTLMVNHAPIFPTVLIRVLHSVKHENVSHWSAQDKRGRYSFPLIYIYIYFKR